MIFCLDSWKLITTDGIFIHFFSEISIAILMPWSIAHEMTSSNNKSGTRSPCGLCGLLGRFDKLNKLRAAYERRNFICSSSQNLVHICCSRGKMRGDFAPKSSKESGPRSHKSFFGRASGTLCGQRYYKNNVRVLKFSKLHGGFLFSPPFEIVYTVPYVSFE